MQNMRWVGFTLAALVANALACSSDQASETSIVVSVQHNFEQALTGAWVRVYPVGADYNNPLTKPVSEQQTFSAADIPRPFKIEKKSADAVLVVVRGFGAGGPTDIRVEHAVTARFVRGKTMAMPVFLEKVCERNICNGAPGMTCYGESHASTCEGTCGPVYEHDTMFEVERAGEERPSGLAARACPKMDGGTDAGDGAVDDAALDGDIPSKDGAPKDGDVPDAISISPTTCTSLLPGSVCELFPECGCAGDTHCTFQRINSTTIEPEVSCEHRGTAVSGGKCNVHEDCAPGHACFGKGTDRLCYPLCESGVNCKSNESCEEINVGEAVGVYGLCMPRCSVNSDCATKCCDGFTCSPQIYCASDAGTPPPLGLCTLQEFDEGCTKDSDCCGNHSNMGGICAKFLDGSSQCLTACTLPSDCDSKLCCAQGACHTQTWITDNLGDAGTANLSTLCGT
jgi:hypothetical protein